MNFAPIVCTHRIWSRGPRECWKSIFVAALLFALLSPTEAAAPDPRQPANLAKVDPKAMAFLDNVAASYRKVGALSVRWHSNSPTSYQPTKSYGTFIWRNSKPPQVRYEDFTNKKFVISGDVSIVATDEITQFFLAGRNPLRSDTNDAERSMGTFVPTGARLLGPLVIKGVRCRGVQFLHTVEMRDNYYAEIFTLWFDKQNLLRRFQKAETHESFQVKSLVDFDVTPNPKLSPILFRYSKPAVSPAKATVSNR